MQECVEFTLDFIFGTVLENRLAKYEFYNIQLHFRRLPYTLQENS